MSSIVQHSAPWYEQWTPTAAKLLLGHWFLAIKFSLREALECHRNRSLVKLPEGRKQLQ